MKITRVDVRGFGAVREQSLQFDAPVTLIHGANEAGKSTLTGFIRSVLFGFAPRGQTGERYEPADGGAFGGALSIMDDLGREVLVERFEASGRAKSSAGIVKVTLPDGSTGGEEALQDLLGGISADAFRALFAFGLSELQELRTLQKDEVGGYLYTAGLGVPPSAMFEAERRLTAGMERLFKAKGKNPEINLAMKDLDDLEQVIRREKELYSRYEGWKAEHSRSGERIEAIEAERIVLHAEADWTRICLKARDTWLRLRIVDGELSELPVWDAFPEDAVMRWDSLQSEHDRLTEDWTKYRLKIEELDERIADLLPDEQLLDSKADVEWLLSRIPAYQADVRSAAELAAELEQNGKELQRVLRLIDPEWNEEALERFPVSAAAREQLSQHKSRLLDTERERDKIAAEASEIAGQIETVDRDLAALTERLRVEAEERQDDTVYELIREAGYDPAAYFRTLESQYGLLLRLEQERGYATQRKEDERQREQLAEQLEAARKREAATRRTLVWFGLSAGSAVLAAWLLAEQRYGFAAAAIGAALAGIGGAIGFGRKSRSAASLADSGRMARKYPGRLVAESGFTSDTSDLLSADAVASDKLGHLERQFVEAQAALTMQAQPLLAYLETAAAASDVRSLLDASLASWSGGCADWQRRRERTASLADQAAELRQERSHLEAQAKAAATRLEALDKSYASASAAWDDWLQRWGFSLPLSPGAVQESLPLMEQGHALLHGQRRLAAKLAAVKETAGSFAAAAIRLLGEAAAVDPALGVQRRGEALAQELRKREEAARAESERREDLLEADALRARLDALQLRQAELLAQAGADGDAGLRANARLYARRVELEGERRHLLPSLAALVSDQRLPELDAALEARSETELAARAAELEERLAELTREANELRDLRGRLAGETAKLERGEALADMLQRREEQLAALRKLGRDYAVRAFALHLLRKAREVYERERQPGVLLRASDYFARMTRGRYAGVRAPIAAERKLEAVRPNGQGVDTAFLSRGTAEQMYLAMRFALAEEFAPRAALPLIMDDILVNFDEDRMRSCLDVLRELGDRRQILLFTCHRHVRDAAMECIPELQLVEL